MMLFQTSGNLSWRHSSPFDALEIGEKKMEDERNDRGEGGQVGRWEGVRRRRRRRRRKEEEEDGTKKEMES
jgi:hypothetical protein